MAESPRKIPLYDSVTQWESHAAGGSFACGEFADDIRKRPVRGAAHRHDHPELFWFESGAGVLMNDLVAHRIVAPALVLVDAGHVHAWPEYESLRGLRLSFDAAFARCDHGGGAPLFPEPRPVVIPLDTRRAPAVAALTTRMREEWSARQQEYLCALRDLLGLLLIEARRAHREHAPEAAPETASAKLHRTFCELLERRVSAEFGVAEAAAALGVHADHLSAVTRERTGRSAGFLIRARLLLEARRLLVHSRLGVAEIAHHLGYADPSYFGKVFAADQGCAPGEFRRRHTGAGE